LALQAILKFGGMGNYVFDYLPSLVGMLLLCGLIPSLITKNRLRKGSVSYLTSSSSVLPENAFLRSALLALLIGVACWALVFISFSFLAVEKIAVWKAYLIKQIFIVSLGCLATYIGIYTTFFNDRTALK
jgi:hypothetical protein